VVVRLFTLVYATALVAVLLPAEAAGAAPSLLIRNQYTPFLAFYDPPPLPAAPPTAWRLAVSLDYSSLFQEEGDSATGGVVDMEVGRLALHAGRRAGRRLAVDIEVPFIWTGRGFLDDFVNDWHSTFRLPNGSRDRAPSDLHRYRLTIGGDTVIDRERGGAGLGDLAATVSYLLTRSDAPLATAVRLGIKAPTSGNDLSLRGSGGWDYALGLIAEAQRSRWSTAVHVAAIYPTGVSEVNVGPFFTGLLNLTWEFVERLDLIAELAGRTSPFDTGLEIFDDPALELRLGVRKGMGHHRAIEVAFVEDLTHRTTPDFSLHIAWRITTGE
jgi:hypothetical protein